MAETTPRITAPYLEAFSHSTVRMLGKVRQLRGESATIDAGGSVNVFLNRVCLSPSLIFLTSTSSLSPRPGVMERKGKARFVKEEWGKGGREEGIVG